MSEPDYKAEFFSKLRVDDEKLWSIIPYLAKTSEPERRRLLRPHAEAGFDFEQDQPLLEKRLAVDRALGKLTLLEIAFELQIVSENEVAEHSASFAVILEQFKGLLGSQALLRYASAYLYFGIRLLAGRIAPPAWFVSRPAQPLTRSNNERSFPLASPPPVPPTESTNQRFRVFLRQRRTTTVEMAQAFLDDFLVTDSELEELQKITEPEQRRRELERLLGDRDPNNLELWLRGLRPETDVATDLYFRRVSAGMMSMPSEAREGLDGITRGLEALLEEIRVFSQGLHPALLARSGLGPSLRELARRSPIPVSVTVPTGPRFPEPVETAVYYVVSEALANAAKHSRAGQVSVTVDSDATRVRAVISDDGVGGAALGRSSGLIGLVDRVEALGGRLTLESPVGRGTSISAQLPLGVQAAQERPVL